MENEKEKEGSMDRVGRQGRQRQEEEGSGSGGKVREDEEEVPHGPVVRPSHVVDVVGEEGRVLGVLLKEEGVGMGFGGSRGRRSWGGIGRGRREKESQRTSRGREEEESLQGVLRGQRGRMGAVGVMAPSGPGEEDEEEEDDG